MYNHSVAFLDVQNGFTSPDDGLLNKALNVQSATEYTVENKAEVAVLAEKIASDSSTEFSVTYINVRHHLSNEILNDISEQVQEAVKKAGHVQKHVMAITGRQGGMTNDQLVSLLQTESVSLAGVTTAQRTLKAQATVVNVKDYLFPNTLSGILAMLFIVVAMIIGFMMLMSVQTPKYFAPEIIDFGKIEK